jgi:polysaccharide chain length determinant protein (PEP-CTERM system associated)
MDQLLEQLVEHLRAIWRWRFWGLAVAWLAGVTGLVIVFLIPPQYQASARVYVDTQSVLKPLMSGLAIQPDVEQQVAILGRTLLSRPNVEKVIRLADLDLKVKSEQQREALIDRIIKTVDLKGSSADNLFSISFSDTDPQKAKRTVEALLSIFVESGLGNKRRDTAKAQQFLDAQIREYEAQLADAERRLKEFKLKNLQYLGSGQDAVSGMLALGDQIGEVRTELRAAEEARDAMRRQLEGEEPVFIPEGADLAKPQNALSESPEIDARIDALNRNLDDLLRRYTDQHPDVIGTRRLVADLEKEREAQLEARRLAAPAVAADAPVRSNVDRNPVYQQLKVAVADGEAKVAALRARAAQLESRYNQIRATAQLKPELEEQLGQLNRDYQVQKSNFDQLVTRRESAKMTSEMDESAGVADFRVIDPPRVSPKPVAPNRQMLLTAAFALSLGAGVGTSFVLGQTLPTFSTSKALQAIGQRLVLGSVAFRPTPAQHLRQRRKNYVFFAGLTGFLAFFGLALGLLLVTSQTA